MSLELSPRRQWVLKVIVEEYVASATPVSSETIARKALTRVSTATLRNEMAVLEELGLLRHPHTSAGRVPSDAGYRYYVEQLMAPAGLQPAEQRMIYHQFHQVQFAIDEWLVLARAVLAQALQNAALAPFDVRILDSCGFLECSTHQRTLRLEREKLLKHRRNIERKLSRKFASINWP